METVERFRCPGCYQYFTIPPASVRLIIKHMKEKHGESHDHKWVKRRIEEVEIS